jgi:hypothetical protein
MGHMEQRGLGHMELRGLGRMELRGLGRLKLRGLEAAWRKRKHLEEERLSLDEPTEPKEGTTGPEGGMAPQPCQP